MSKSWSKCYLIMTCGSVPI